MTLNELRSLEMLEILIILKCGFIEIHATLEG